MNQPHMTYVALLRGIGPGNPNMTNEKLRDVFESLGYEHVRSVISSGNILFDAPSQDQAKLEQAIQSALAAQLGIAGGTIIRSGPEIVAFHGTRPFGEREHGPASYLTVTFLKNRATEAKLAPVAAGRSYQLLSFDDQIQAICALTDTTATKTPDFMVWLEKQYSKDITTRTWKTVERIAKLV